MDRNLIRPSNSDYKFDTNDKENIYFYSGSPTPGWTPAKPRLGKFVDVYSPEHLNLTPKNKPTRHLNIRNESPDWCASENQRERQSAYKCRTVKARTHLRHVVGDCSFEGNQSFPRLSRRLRPIKMELETPAKTKPVADYVRVDGPNGLRFNTSLATVESSGSPGQSQTERLQQTVGSSKAVFTIEPSSTKILIVNNKACSLLGYSSGELCGMSFSELLHSRTNQAFKLQEPEDPDSSEERPVVLLSGKVVEVLCKDGSTVQVSLWIRQLDNEGPCLVVAEPVRCLNVKVLVEAETGLVAWGGAAAGALFGAEGALAGLPAARLLPALRLPAAAATADRLYKQKLTGRTLDGSSFPLCLWISKADTADLSLVPAKYRDKTILEVNIRVTYNVSGLLVVDEAGVVTACNPHFALLTFGAPLADVVGQPVGRLLPGFCRPARRMPPPAPTGSDSESSVCSALEGSQVRARGARARAARPKSCSPTPTPTQDMVSSISTEHRPDLPTSALSALSIDDDFCPSLSKSRSENILRSEHNPARAARPGEKSDSIYYTSQHSQELTPTGAPRLRVADPSLRLSFDSTKYRARTTARDDRSSVSLELCDSNETSADFLTPINELPAGCELPELPELACLPDLPPHNGTDSADSFYDNELDTHTESVPRMKYNDDPETPCMGKRVLRSHMTTSTPQRRADCESADTADSVDTADTADTADNADTADTAEGAYRDGTYCGTLLHRDGTELDVVYSVSSMWLSTGARVRCVWVRVRQPGPPSRAPSHASTADGDRPKGNRSGSSRAASMSLASQAEEQLAGEYSRHYVTLNQIGKGAYGCVKMAYRRSDRLLAVAKFILKEKVGAQLWVDAADGRRLPLELSLLLTLHHPNIVSVLDAFENDKYFQMVMERHGAGMDLFEFIERRPRLDEPLLSYIFRQIGQAVEYLHGLNILHRDIKDENVIIDHRFHVKLIDFGSATFMSRDSLFSTFYGTTEYCSPEVLAGNKYAGPELEVWSLGVTLYVLTFFVNPFSDIEDTIQGPLTLPHPVSDELEQLLRWMLHKVPEARCTVAQLMAHAWTTQPVAAHAYSFPAVVDCDPHEANPDMYYRGPDSPRSGSPPSPPSPVEHHTKGSWRERSGEAGGSGGGARGGAGRAPPAAPPDPASDNYSLRSSADILDISSKPVSEAALTDMSSDATGHAACDIACDCGRGHACDCVRDRLAACDIACDCGRGHACDCVRDRPAACDCGRGHACDCARDRPAPAAPDALADSWASDINDQDSFS